MEREILRFCPHPLPSQVKMHPAFLPFGSLLDPSRGRGKHERETFMLGWGEYIASITLSMTDKQSPIAYTLVLTTQSHIQIRDA